MSQSYPIIALHIFILIAHQSNGQMVRCDSEHETCDCPSAELSSGFCILDCNEDDSCKQQTLNCRDGDTCHIICDGTSSCSNATIDGNKATDVLIMCSAENACAQSMDINCGLGLCSLHCDTNTSCSDLGSIDITHASFFECIGFCPSSFSTKTVPQNTNKANKQQTNSLISTISTGSLITILAVLLCALSLICFMALWLYGCCLLRMRRNEGKNTIKYTQSVASASNTPVSLTPISLEIATSPIYFTTLSPAKQGIFPDTHPVFEEDTNEEMEGVRIPDPIVINPESPSNSHIVCKEDELNLEKMDKTDDARVIDMDFCGVEEKEDIADDESGSTTYTVSTYVSSSCSSSDCETPEVSEWVVEDKTLENDEEIAANRILRTIYMGVIGLSVIEDED